MGRGGGGGGGQKIVYSEKYALENAQFFVFCVDIDRRGLSRRGQFYDHIYTQGLHDNIMAFLLMEFYF